MGKELQLVSFEQAKKLKEMGFNYPTYGYYYTDGRLFNNAQGSFIDWNKLGGVYLSAPEIALVFQWLRQEKNIIVNIEYVYLNYFIRSDAGDILYENDNKFKSDVECESSALDKALQLLETK